MIAVWRQGTTVRLRVTGLEGIITEVRISGDAVLYLVGYFENSAYAEKWFIEAQFDVVSSPGTLPIGFKP